MYCYGKHFGVHVYQFFVDYWKYIWILYNIKVCLHRVGSTIGIRLIKIVKVKVDLGFFKSR